MKQKEKNNTLKKFWSRSLRILLISFPIIVTIIYVIFQMMPFINGKINSYSAFTFFTVVEESNSAIRFSNKNKPLYKGDRITGEFTASENNLGLVLVRLFNYNKTNSGQVSFTLRDKIDNNLNIKNTYNVDQFQPNEYFTFGFPLISNSKGKKYSFEIISLSGKKGEAISLSKKKPSFAAIYNFSGGELKSNKATLARFVYKKIIFALNNVNYKDIFLFDLVFILIIIYLRNSSKFNKQNVANNIKQKIINILLITSIGTFLLSLLEKIVTVTKALWTNVCIFYKNNKNLVTIVCLVIIFVLALVARFSFFLDPENRGRLIYWGLGGSGDYDQLFKHSILYLANNNKLFDFYSYSNDYSILVRFYAFFFSTFNFINGFKYSIYLFIIGSCLVCLLPFIMASKKVFPVGGFIASILLALSSLYIWLASSRSVDTMTTLFFSLFIILFAVCINRKNFILALFLGIVGFLDGYSRGIMMVNNIPALCFFAIYITFYSARFNKKFPYIHIKIKDLVYALTPLIVILLLFAVWETWFYMIFHKHWFVFFRQFNLVQGSQIITTHKDQINGINMGNYIYHIYFAFLQFVKIIDTPAFLIMVLTGIGIVFKTIKGWKKQLYILFILPIIFIVSLYIIPIFHTDRIMGDVYVNRLPLFLDILNIKVFLLLEFILLQFIFLRQVFIQYAMLIVVYFMMMAYGIITDFQDRHFIQVLIVFFILLGLTIDKVINLEDIKGAFIKNITRSISIAAISIFLGVSLLSFYSYAIKLNKNVQSSMHEKQYLEYASKIIPNDGTILIWSTKDNFMMVSEVLKRNIVFNVNIPDPLLIPYNKPYFYVPYLPYEERDIVLDYKGSNVINDFSLNAITKGRDVNKYKFYVLDYDIHTLNEKMQNGNDIFPSFYPGKKYFLERINEVDNQRPVYKLKIQD